MIADVVVAAMAPDGLGEALAAIHRAGLGHTARVMRAVRGDPVGQLRRAGIPVESGPARLAEEECLLTVGAAARSEFAAPLLLRHGASAVWIVSPGGRWREIDDAVAAAPRPQAPGLEIQPSPSDTTHRAPLDLPPPEGPRPVD